MKRSMKEGCWVGRVGFGWEVGGRRRRRRRNESGSELFVESGRLLSCEGGEGAWHGLR